MFYCFLHLAARRNEIFALRWSDIHFNEKKIRLFTRKRKDGYTEYDWLPLTDFLFKEFKIHLDSRKNDLEYVFPNPRTHLPYVHRDKWMRRICLKANVPPFGLHAIRHLSASILMENDVPLIDIQTILRHKSISTTERYIHRLKSVRESISIFDKKVENLK